MVLAACGSASSKYSSSGTIAGASEQPLLSDAFWSFPKNCRETAITEYLRSSLDGGEPLKAIIVNEPNSSMSDLADAAANASLNSASPNF